MLGLRLFLLLSLPLDVFARGGYSNCRNGSCDTWGFFGVLLIGFLISGSIADIHKNKSTMFEKMFAPAVGVFITAVITSFLFCKRDSCVYFLIFLCTLFMGILFLFNRIEPRESTKNDESKGGDKKYVPNQYHINPLNHIDANNGTNKSTGVIRNEKYVLSTTREPEVVEITETPDSKKIYCPTCNRQYDPRYFYKSSIGDDFSQCRVCKTDVEKTSRLKKKTTRLVTKEIPIPNGQYCHVCKVTREFAESSIGPSWRKCTSCGTHIQSSSSISRKS